MGDPASRSRSFRRLAFVIVSLVGLAVRLPQLGVRPMHTDEAVNAYITGQLLAGQPFAYDPQDRHGPALAALALPLARIQGARSFSDLTESELRLTSVIAGTVTILLFGAAVELFGFLPCLLAALLFALAPLPVYYDRYFIHESLFIAATFALILTAARAFQTVSVLWSTLAGVSAALMLACKETAVLHFFALAAAALVFRFWNLRGRPRAPMRFQPVIAAAVAFLALVAILFTWFGRNGHALRSLLLAVPEVLSRAAGQGHQKPFWYYGRLLVGGWSGGLLMVLAAIGFALSIRKRGPSPYGFLAYYAIFIAATYSLIPYKTPWLALNLWLPLTLLAAKAVQRIWVWAAAKMPWHAALPAFCALALVAAVLIAHDTRWRVFLHPADETNPYAYAHTTDDIIGLPAEISDLARRNHIADPRIAVIASDPWPLPWYLRRFSQTGFWQPGQPVAPADFYITSTDAANHYADQLRDFRPEFFGVRPNVLVLLWSRESK